MNQIEAIQIIHGHLHDVVTMEDKGIVRLLPDIYPYHLKACSVIAHAGSTSPAEQV
jgi:hypothetical protein